MIVREFTNKACKACGQKTVWYLVKLGWYRCWSCGHQF